MLTFDWMKGALLTKRFRTLFVNNIHLANNQVSSLTAAHLKNWKRDSFFKGKPRWLTAERELGMRKIKQGCHTHTFKELPWVFLQTCQGERERKRLKNTETKEEWEKFYWVRPHLLPLSPNVNICGWLMLASELSAVREGLVLIVCDSSGKGQQGGEAGAAAHTL